MAEWDGPRVLPAGPDDGIDLDLIDTGGPAGGWAGRTAVLLLVVVVATLIGIRVADATGPTGRAYAPARAVGPPVPVRSDDPAFTGELATLVLAPPAGVTAAPVTPLSVDDVGRVVVYPGVDPVRYLYSLDLARAVSGGWHTGRDRVDLIVQQFATEREAFLWRMQEQGFATPALGLRDLGPVPGLAGTHAFGRTTDPGTVLVFLSRGDLGVRLTVHIGLQPDLTQVADLARRQYGLLP